MPVQIPAALQIPECAGCGRASSALSPRPDRAVALAQCGACEQRVYVLDDPAGYPDLHKQAVAQQGFKPSRHLSLQRSSAINRLIEELGDLGASPINERRLSQRLAVAVAITVTPLDEWFLPLGNAYNAATIDLSSTGMAFVSSTNRHACYWLIDFSLAGYNGRQSIIKPIRVEHLDASYWKTVGPLLSAYDEPLESGNRLIHTHRRM